MDFIEEKETLGNVISSLKIKLKNIEDALPEQEEKSQKSMHKLDDIEHLYVASNRDESMGKELDKVYDEHRENMNLFNEMEYNRDYLIRTIHTLERIFNEL